MWADKDFVLPMVRLDGSLLKFAKDGISQDPDCLKAIGLGDVTCDNKQYARSEVAILSVKFSLSGKVTTFATAFALAMKSDRFLKDFKTHKVWCKTSCDPMFTNMDHPCRGTLTTCTFPDTWRNFTTDANGKKKPCSTSCWRYLFRFHQKECKATNGLMIQVEESEGLGAGQKIETVMAKQLGLKVFRTYTDESIWQNNTIEKISQSIEEWYTSGCLNMDLENVHIGKCGSPWNPRPQYEKLE